MKLLASITVATAAANSFFAPNNKGYSSLEEAKVCFYRFSYKNSDIGIKDI